MDDIIDDIHREYDPDYGEQLPLSEVHYFYRHQCDCIATADTNQCYNDIIELIINIILSNHNMLND
jgi:hypothetical protein